MQLNKRSCELWSIVAYNKHYTLSLSRSKREGKLVLLIKTVSCTRRRSDPYSTQQFKSFIWIIKLSFKIFKRCKQVTMSLQFPSKPTKYRIWHSHFDLTLHGSTSQEVRCVPKIGPDSWMNGTRSLKNKTFPLLVSITLKCT